MECVSCQSGKLAVFTSEINLHFPGFGGIDKPTVWVFPNVTICLDCGLAQFSVPDVELRQLSQLSGVPSQETAAS